MLLVQQAPAANPLSRLRKSYARFKITKPMEIPYTYGFKSSRKGFVFDLSAFLKAHREQQTREQQTRGLMVLHSTRHDCIAVVLQSTMPGAFLIFGCREPCMGDHVCGE